MPNGSEGQGKQLPVGTLGFGYFTYFTEGRTDVVRGVEPLTVHSDPGNAWGYCIGNSMWSASELLLRFMRTGNEIDALCDAERGEALQLQRERLFAGKRCIELGCGLGVVGMAAAKLGTFSEVLLTDVEEMMPLLRYNISQNFQVGQKDTDVDCALWGAAAESSSSPADKQQQPEGEEREGAVSRRDTRVHAQVLDWTQPQLPVSCKGPWDAILASDVAYNPDSFGAFWATLSLLLQATFSSAASSTPALSQCSSGPESQRMPTPTILLALPDRHEEGDELSRFLHVGVQVRANIISHARIK